MTSDKFYGKKIIVACFIIMFSVYGVVSTSALFFPSLAEGVNSDISSVAIMSSTYGAASVVAGLVADKLFKKIGYKYSCLIGCLLIAFHYVLFSIATSVYQLWAYACLGGIGFAFGTIACVSSIVESWYNELREKMIGYVCAGTGIGAATWVLVAGQLITRTGYQNAYRIQAALVCIIAVPVILFMIKTPEEVGQKPFGIVQDIKSALVGPEAKEVVKMPAFWIMMIGLVAVGFTNLNFESYTPAFWQENGESVVATSIYLSVYYILGAVLTAVAGVIAQKFGVKVYIAYLCGVFMLGTAMIILWAGNHSPVYLWVCVIAMSASFALYSSVPGTVTTEAYGTRSYTTLCTWLTMGYSIGQFLGPLQFSFTLSSSGSYVVAYITLFVVAAIAMICVLLGLNLSPMKRHPEKHSTIVDK